MKKTFCKITAILLAVICFTGILPEAAMRSEAKSSNKNIVVMIDPGHGGTNMGGQFNTLDEKNLTIITAEAMKAELEQYEGITVYLTRTQDVDMSLADRAKAAKTVSADFLISLHYNMSVEHNIYGAEVWTPSVGTPYAQGHALGSLFLDEFDQLGIFRRGVKTKLSTKAQGQEYYGIIRESTKRGIPAVIVEHCHLDNPVDKSFYNSIESLQKFGRLDATAVAKYFGLKSTALGVDYSNYPKLQVQAPTVPIAQDMTDPEICKTTVTYHNSKTGTMGLQIEGQDADSGIYYYSYSLDGGASWSALQTMPQGTKSVAFDVKIPEGQQIRQVVGRVYNGYDRKTDSAPVSY